MSAFPDACGECGHDIEAHNVLDTFMYVPADNAPGVFALQASCSLCSCEGFMEFDSGPLPEVVEDEATEI